MKRNQIKYIHYKKKLLAILISKKHKYKKVNFLTSKNLGFQAATMKRPKNEIIKKHTHPNYSRKIIHTSELLFIKSGLVNVRLFFKISDKKPVKSFDLSSGDSIIFYGGCHEFKFKKTTSMLEIKQGPYKEKKDKVISK